MDREIKERVESLSPADRQELIGEATAVLASFFGETYTLPTHDKGRIEIKVPRTASRTDLRRVAEWARTFEPCYADVPDREAPEGMKFYRFQLRPDFEAQMLLPADLNRGDVERLSQFLEFLVTPESPDAPH